MPMLQLIILCFKFSDSKNHTKILLSDFKHFFNALTLIINTFLQISVKDPNTMDSQSKAASMAATPVHCISMRVDQNGFSVPGHINVNTS